MRSLVGLGLSLAFVLGGCLVEEPVSGIQEAVYACGRLPDGGTRWCADEGWDGGYHCVDNSCHNAASGGVNDHKGILSCNGYYTGPYGHTINWDNPQAGTLCIEEPQRPGEGPAVRQTCNGTALRECISVSGCRWTGLANRGTCGGTPTNPTVSGGTCCWNGALTAEGVPELTSAGALNCLGLLCPPSNPGEGPPVAHPPGYVWDTSYLECRANNAGNVNACVACCEANANAVPDYWGPPDTCAREEYRNRCRATCGAGPSPTPRLQCECIGQRQQCLDARCGWRPATSSCVTTPLTPPLPPVPPPRDAGTPDAGSTDAGVDASDGSSEAGSDASSEAGSEAGTDASSEAGSEAGTDASREAGSEAGT